MHHKRKRPKKRRSGCLLCKPHKMNGSRLKDRDPHRDRRRQLDAVTLVGCNARE